MCVFTAVVSDQSNRISILLSQVHMEQICEQVLVSCPEGCGEKHLRGKVTLLDDQIACIWCYNGVDQYHILAH